jgi:transposase-like protein
MIPRITSSYRFAEMRKRKEKINKKCPYCGFERRRLQDYVNGNARMRCASCGGVYAVYPDRY